MYPKMAYRYVAGEEDAPETWKERYFVKTVFIRDVNAINRRSSGHAGS